MDGSELFAGYKGVRTALYGLGTETEKALRELEPDYQIVGLLDSFNGGRGKTDYCGCPARLLQGNRKEDRAVVPTERDWPDGYSRKGFAGG